MRPVVFGLGWIVAVVSGMVPASAQKAVDPDLVAAVRSAIAKRGVEQGLKTLNEYRSVKGVTPETIEALSWLARGALAAKQFDKANQYAADAYDLAIEALKGHTVDNEAHLHTVIGAAIEVTALS